MIPRINTRLSDYAALSGYAAYRNASRFVRDHSRASVMAAAALTVGGISAAGAAGGVTPWAESTHIASGVLSGQAGTSIANSIAGVKAPGVKTPGANTAQLDYQPIGVPNTPAKAAHHGAAAPTQAPNARPVPTHAPPVVNVPAHAAPAHPAKPHPAAPQAAPQPYEIYDSVTPSSIPWGKSLAAYADGNYQASFSDVAHHSNVLWIDVHGTNPGANVLDVEPGDATPAGAAQWVQMRLNAHKSSIAIVYTFRGDWSAVKQYVGGLPSWMQARVHYWIADPTGVPHILPGSSATQWYWGSGYDISTANHNFQIP